MFRCRFPHFSYQISEICHDSIHRRRVLALKQYAVHLVKHKQRVGKHILCKRLDHLIFQSLIELMVDHDRDRLAEKNQHFMWKARNPCQLVKSFDEDFQQVSSRMSNQVFAFRVVLHADEFLDPVDDRFQEFGSELKS